MSAKRRARAVRNQDTGALLASRCRLADSFLTRLRGLLGTSALPAGEGLLLKPCSSVHTFGMRYSLDVLYLSDRGQVLRLVPDLAPMRPGPLVRGTKMVLELPAGTLAATGTREGHQLSFEPSL